MDIDYVVFIVILALNVIDYITGLIGGTMVDGFDSSKMRRGLFHKFTYWILIGLCYMVGLVGPYIELGSIVVDGLMLLACSWIVITECGSIMENLIKINPELENSPFMAIFKNKDTREKEDTQVKEVGDDFADCRR